ncbi:MAG: nuclear transport factor 2 family protein [Pyrinomonadaceae bacterium]
MSTRAENIEVVEEYMNSLKRRDVRSMPFADDLTFEDPIAGKGTGAENRRAFLSGFLLAVRDFRVHQFVCEGEYVVAYWEVDSIWGPIGILEKFQVQNGKITDTVAYFDPRLIVGS